MAQHADILDEQESLRNPFIASVAFHAGIFAILIAWNALAHGNKLVLGTTNPGYGSSVSVNSVRTLPLPSRRGPLNPVAHDTENQIPQRQPEKAKPQPKKVEPPKNAVPVRSRAPEKPAPHDYLKPQYRAQPLRRDQVTGSQPQAAVLPTYVKPGSAAGVGLNPTSLVGTRFGAYAQALMEAVGSHWNTGGLAGVRVPTAIVNVDILRDGSIRNPRIVQSSGNSDVDRSALRAVIEAVNQAVNQPRIPPLPPDYSGSYLNVDFLFQLHP
jgi:TonB family protein